MIDNRMLGFLRPTPVPGPLGARRKRDSLEFLMPGVRDSEASRASNSSKAS